ncbi:M12 family metallo-peptidase [Longirhabdus pacifica]|uniref:M12 family metallo-peptidase n=1 Tax=Longirhabdus pacifica TaxID=2305227 RepID=UPI0010093135|nr:M12 family metallo-peptidase [Longirhabdus pacifica]
MKKVLTTLTAAALIFSFQGSVNIGATTNHDHEHDHEMEGNAEIHMLPKDISISPEDFIVEDATVERTTVATLHKEDGTKESVFLSADAPSLSITSANNSFGLNAVETGDKGTHVVNVLIAADEEYRARHRDWVDYTKNIVERMDDTFNRDFDIDFNIVSYVEWASEGTDAGSILYDLRGDHGSSQYDFVMGFSADRKFNAGGVAYVYRSAPSVAISVMLDQSYSATWHAAIHEIGHNYGLSHIPQGSGIKGIMNYDYSYSVDYFSPDHTQDILNRKWWYGR